MSFEKIDKSNLYNVNYRGGTVKRFRGDFQITVVTLSLVSEVA